MNFKVLLLIHLNIKHDLWRQSSKLTMKFKCVHF